MKRTLAIAAVTLALLPQIAVAGERPADAALGALSGALVFGPVGLVAGAVVGYTAGPSISHGMRRGEPRQGRRSYVARASVGEPQPAPPDSRPQPAPPATPMAAAPAPAAAPPARSAATTTPPVQPLE